MKLIIRIRWEENRRHRQKAIPVSLEEGERVRTETIMFDIVNMDYSYTTIFSRGFTNKFEVVIKQSYLCMKMPSPFGIITIHGDQLASRSIEGKPIPRYSLINEVTKNPKQIEQGSKKTISPRAETREDTQRTPLTEAVLDKCVHIGMNLLAQEKQGLISFLHENNDVFAWSANDLKGISRNLAQHNLILTKGSTQGSKN